MPSGIFEAAERLEDPGLDVAAKRAGLCADIDEQIERDVARRRRIGFVTCHPVAVEQIDQIDVLWTGDGLAAAADRRS